jgi:hypothetical protein
MISRNKTIGRVQLLPLLALLLLAGLVQVVPHAAVALVTEQVSAGPAVFLPLVIGPAPAKSSFELIEEALAAGELDAETALIYQVYAITLDPRLPAKYRGVDEDVLESSALREVVRRWDSLSAEAQALLAPFLTPPAYEGSWADPATAWRVAETGSSGAQAAVSPADDPLAHFCWSDPPFPGPLPGWERLITAHTTIWYQTAGDVWPSGYQLATPEQTAATAHAAASVIEHIIQQETGLMNRWPIFDTNVPCNGGDGSIDIYITRRNSKTGAQVIPYPPGDVERPGYIWLAPDYAKGDLKTVRDALAHEFFHLISLSYPQARTYSPKGLPEYEWLDEASANYMVEYVYPDDQFEHEAARDYLQLDYLTSLEVGLERGTNGYSDYVYLLFLAERLGPPVLRAIWDKTPTLDSLGAVDAGAQAAGGFATLWPEFALVAWNDWQNGFLDDLHKWDGLEAGASRAGNLWAPQDAALDGKSYAYHAIYDSGLVEHVAMGMSRHVFVDPNVRSVLFDNMLQGVRGAHIWALLKVGGQWQVEDWTDRRYPQYCRQLAGERLEELVILVTNSVFDDRDYVLDYPAAPGQYPMLYFTNVACGEWQGTITTLRGYADEGFEHWEATETNVTFVRAPERVGPDQGGMMTWKVQEGSTTRWSGYESYNECHTLPKQVDVPIQPDLSGLNVVAAAPEAEFSLIGQYVGAGWVQHQQQMDYVCTFGSVYSETWYLTNNWWPYPQSGQFEKVSPDGRVMEGQFEQMDGDYTVTVNWRLEAVEP